MKFASFMAQQNQSFKDGKRIFRFCPDELFMYKDIVGHPQGEPLTGTYWFKDTQICVARDNVEGKKRRLLLCSEKGGNNQKAITINDVGVHPLPQCPAGADIGMQGRYLYPTDLRTERYTIWTMQSDYHNPPPHQRNPAEERGAAHSQQYKATAKTVSYQVDIVLCLIRRKQM